MTLDTEIKGIVGKRCVGGAAKDDDRATVYINGRMTTDGDPGNGDWSWNLSRDFAGNLFRQRRADLRRTARHDRFGR